MANPSGKKGYEGEWPVAAFLEKVGFTRIIRLRNQGVLDKGDIGGIDGVCIEVKNQNRYDIPRWLRETLREKRNAGAETAALVVKPIGVGSTRVGEWWVVLTLDDYSQLLKKAGYGPVRDTDGSIG